MKLELLQDKIIKLLREVDEKTFMDFAIEWLGEERIFDEVKESIQDYNNKVILEDAYKQLKKGH